MFGYDSLCEHGFDFHHPVPGGIYCDGFARQDEMSSEEAIAYLRAKLTGETPETDCGWTTLVVTFTDGEVVRYPNARFLIDPKGKDPIQTLPNGWLSFEADDTIVTVAGVRSFVLDHLSQY